MSRTTEAARAPARSAGPGEHGPADAVRAVSSVQEERRPALPEQRDPGDPGGVRCVADGCHEPGQHPREACVTVRPKDVQLAVRLRGERH
ncbi:hypothetical protein NXY56_002014 [Leishmania guyanensis]